MNSKQQTIVWIGLILIVLNLFTSDAFKTLWNTVLGKSTSSPAPKTTGNTGTVLSNGQQLTPSNNVVSGNETTSNGVGGGT